MDLDNASIVREIKNYLHKDIANAVKYDGVFASIAIFEDPTVLEKDIPEFLREKEDYHEL